MSDDWDRCPCGGDLVGVSQAERGEHRVVAVCVECGELAMLRDGMREELGEDGFPVPLATQLKGQIRRVLEQAREQRAIFRQAEEEVIWEDPA